MASRTHFLWMIFLKTSLIEAFLVVPCLKTYSWSTIRTESRFSITRIAERHRGSIVLWGQGFGSTSSSSSSSSSFSSSSSGKKKKKKQPSFLLDDTVESEDKWGLPLPTLEDIFPPLPSDTELIPVIPGYQYNRQEIETCLKDYLPLHLQKCFDERGFERNLSMNNTTTNRIPMQLKLVHCSPPVLVIENFLTETECLDVERVAMPRQVDKDSIQSTYDNLVDNHHRNVVQVNSATFALAQSIRTSTSWFCHFCQVPTLIAKLHYWLGIPLEQMEEPQIVRYQQGQEFSWHYDQVPDHLLLNNGGQRLATILVYLNTVQQGGATVFRDLTNITTVAQESNKKKKKKTMNQQPKNENNQDQGIAVPLSVRPQRGRALLFFPALADGTPDERTLHKGQIVTQEEAKKIVQVWIHQFPYRPILPPNNSQSAAKPLVERIWKELGYSSFNE